MNIKKMLCFVAAMVLVCSCVLCGCNSNQADEASPEDATGSVPALDVDTLSDSEDAVSLGSAENENATMISKTKVSLQIYLDVLGVECADGNLDVSEEFVNHVNSVYVMGETGSVTHGFGDDSETCISIMKWIDNNSSTTEKFYEFVSLLNDYYGKAGQEISYDDLSDETYNWIDYDSSTQVSCWYEDETINILWTLVEQQQNGTTSAVENAQTERHTCEECGEEGTYKITGITGQTEYYCYTHYKEILEMYGELIGTEKSEPQTNSYNDSSEKATDAKVCAVKAVKDNLKSPSTADFCSYAEMTAENLGGNQWKISGYVDAENSYGMTLRQDWTVTLTLTDSGFTDYSVSFD